MFQAVVLYPFYRMSRPPLAQHCKLEDHHRNNGISPSLQKLKFIFVRIDLGHLS